MTLIVVIPTAREIHLDYLAPLLDAGARFVIVDDSEGRISLRHPQFEVVNWGDQRRMLGDRVSAIPRRNGSCRDFGYYVAWKTGGPGDLIVSLDDDCVVDQATFPADVERALRGDRERVVAVGPGTHFNALDCYAPPADVGFPRGFPYSARLDYTPWTFEDPSPGPAAFNVGMWRGVFDVNAVDKLRGPAHVFEDARLRHEAVVVPRGVLVSVCGMNQHFRRELIPAAWMPPMHVEVVDGWVVDRHGDIWGGFILKTLMDLRGDVMTVGAPMIHHLKAGDLERNLWQEHLGHLVNDEFLDLLASAAEDVGPADYLEMMGRLSEALASRAERRSPILRAYLRAMLPAMRAWVGALS